MRIRNATLACLVLAATVSGWAIAEAEVEDIAAEEGENGLEQYAARGLEGAIPEAVYLDFDSSVDCEDVLVGQEFQKRPELYSLHLTLEEQQVDGDSVFVGDQTIALSDATLVQEHPFAGDFDHDGIVGITDFLQILVAWGDCPHPCPQDLDGDDVVGIVDLLILLGLWGPGNGEASYNVDWSGTPFIDFGSEVLACAEVILTSTGTRW